MLDWSEYLQMAFIQRMFIAGLLASLACGVVGTLVVVKRNVFIAGGISHTTFGGIGLAYYLQSLGLTWFDPMYGAVLFAVGAALVMGMNAVKKRLREDSTIGGLWVLGMAAGILFLNMVDRTEVTVQSPESILFGNILLISRADLIMMAVLLAVIYVFIVLTFKDMEMLTFDEEYSAISGIKVGIMNMVLLVLIALTVTIMIKVVGVVLIIAMLVIPAAVANLFTKRLLSMMIWATVIGIVLTTAGNVISVELDAPPGASIVLLMGSVFLVALFVKWTTSQGLLRGVSVARAFIVGTIGGGGSLLAGEVLGLYPVLISVAVASLLGLLLFIMSKAVKGKADRYRLLIPPVLMGTLLTTGLLEILGIEADPTFSLVILIYSLAGVLLVFMGKAIYTVTKSS